MSKVKKITGDLCYSIAAVGLMNVVLQFLIYPVINYRTGAAEFGNMLFFLGVVSILSPSFGIAVNNTRLLIRNRDSVKNRDFMLSLFIFSLISIFVSLGICIYKKSTILSTIFIIYIVIITIYRNYSSVEFRLELNYKKQFTFYLILSVGYIVGLLVFLFIKKWEVIYILGETVAVLFVVFTGKIYKNLGEYSSTKNYILKNSTMLAANYVITNLMLNLDRLMLLNMVNSEAVSKYYVLSLMGKTIAIISGPLNGILIGYLTKDNKRIGKKELLRTIIILLGVGAVFFIGCIIVTPVYIKIMYPNLYSDVISLNVIVNFSQIFYFLTGILVVIVLTICSSKYILKVQIIYSCIFIITAFVLTSKMEIRGFSYAAAISNLLYFVLVCIVGIYSTNKHLKGEKQNVLKERNS